VNSNLVYIGLGSNIEQPYRQIKNAINALSDLPETSVVKDSGYFKSKPMGPENQPDFVNAVVVIETKLVAIHLLDCCQVIEKQQGRIKHRHWGERTIDLDILLYADMQIHTTKLIVPHPGICLRDFVYIPLLKIEPDIEIPGVGLLSDIVKPTSELAAEKNKTDFACQFVGSIE